MSQHALFAYGTLQDPDVVNALLGRPFAAFAPRPIHAPGFRAVRYPGRTYPALVPSTGAAPGLLLTGLSSADIARLDAFEGPEYRRAPIMLDTAILALAYWPTIPIDARARTWSFAHWQAHHKASMLADLHGKGPS